jgi:MFS family permease
VHTIQYQGSHSLSIQFADYHEVHEQREMTRRFSLIMSFGLLGSFVAGWLMDLIGLVICTFVTLVLGQLHMLIIVFFGDQMPLMTLGFVVYTLFRCFLYPVFIASLSARLGFKYFGILSGIGFATSGLAQLCIAPLVHAVQGSCVDSAEDCRHGAWTQLHIIQLILFILLGSIPLWDHRVDVQRQKAIDLSKIFSSTPMYGAVEGSWSSDDPGLEL